MSFEKWSDPRPGESVVYMSLEKVAGCGGTPPQSFNYQGNQDQVAQVNQGIALLSRWCRINGISPPRPVNVRGRTGMAMACVNDAMMLKLTWG